MDLYVCIEEIPHIRDLQHVFYDKIAKILREEIPPLIMKYQDFENKDKLSVVNQLLLLRRTIQSLGGDAYSGILQIYLQNVQFLSEMVVEVEFFFNSLFF